MKKIFFLFVFLILGMAVGAQSRCSLSKLPEFIGLRPDSLVKVIGGAPKIKVDSVTNILSVDSLYCYDKFGLEEGFEGCRVAFRVCNQTIDQVNLTIPLAKEQADHQYKYLIGCTFPNDKIDYTLEYFGSAFDIYVYSDYVSSVGKIQKILFKKYELDAVEAGLEINSFPRSYLEEMSDGYAMRQVNQQCTQTNRWKLYPTQNIYNSLLLDTVTGAIKIVQWSLEDHEFTYSLCDEQIRSYEKRIIGRYELYPTQNHYQFIMVDTISGLAYHVQWGFEQNKRWIRRIY